MALCNLLLRRLICSKPPFRLSFPSLSTAPDSSPTTPTPTPKPTSLSARMSFIFEQIDEIDKQRQEKDQTLLRIRAWRESKKQPNNPTTNHPPECDSAEEFKSELAKSEKASLENNNVKKEVELVHPWAEWIELMERLLQQNYFDYKRKDEDGMMDGLGLDLSGAATKEEDKGLDFMRDFKTVQDAVINFGRDRFDILRSLSRQDLQILVGYGCASTDKRVVFSSKLLRKHVHLDEGDVCSSCSLRGSCEKAYLLTHKEDEPRAIDVMRVLLAYGFDPNDGSVANKSLLKMKTVKTVVRKLLHEVVKLSAVPIDPNLPPPVIKRPPPKVKQPPPPPKKRVGRNDIEMKKGDWLCPKCDFMNFAKNTVCLQCDAKRPKRQLLPGEWECPQCSFLNYRRNTVCFHCEHNRPPDTYADSQRQYPEKQCVGPRMGMDKIPNKTDVSGAWNFDFDDNESDGADVAAFEYADSHKRDKDFPLGQKKHNNSLGEENCREDVDGLGRSSRAPKVGLQRREYSESFPGVGFNDFDEEDDDDINSYELVAQNEVPKTPRIDFSELEEADDSEFEDIESTNNAKWHGRGRTNSATLGRKQMHNNRKASFADDSENNFDTDDDFPTHPNWKSSHNANVNLPQNRDHRRAMKFVADDDLSSGSNDETYRSKRKKNYKNGMDCKPGGRRSNFRAETLSGTDSDDDDLSYRTDKRRGPTRPGKAARGRGGSMNSGYNRASSGSERNSRRIHENSYNNGKEENGRGGKSSKFGRSHRGRGVGSFDRRGGRSSNNFDNRSDRSSYMDDEIQRRPRTNVR